MHNGISVIVPARNAQGTIAKAVRSVLGTREVSEVIVVNDGSTDKTGEVVRSLPDPRVRIVEGRARGIAAALNRGFEEARGAYVARCDADDTFAPGRLERQLAWLRTKPEFIAVSGAFAATDQHGEVLAKLGSEGPARDVTAPLIAGHWITHFCSWLTRLEAIRRIGGAREWFEVGEDLDIQYRLATQGRVWYDPQLAYFYRLHLSSITHHLREDRQIFYRVCARQFAEQRVLSGTDALAEGSPPVFSAEKTMNFPKLAGARAQAFELFVGRAKQLIKNNQSKRAIPLAIHAIRLRPNSLGGWRVFSRSMRKSIRSLFKRGTL